LVYQAIQPQHHYSSSRQGDIDLMHIWLPIFLTSKSCCVQMQILFANGLALQSVM